MARKHRVQDERRDDDNVVEHRCEGGPEVLPVRVQQARYDGRRPVEHHLHGEELEEEGGERHLILVRVEALGVDDLAGEDDTEHRYYREQNHHNGEQVRGILVAPLPAELLFHRQVHRQERRDEHAAHNQLVEHVGQVVGHLVGAGHEGGSQGEGHGPGAGEAGDARGDDADGDKGRTGSHRLGAGIGIGDGGLGRQGARSGRLLDGQHLLLADGLLHHRRGNGAIEPGMGPHHGNEPRGPRIGRRVHKRLVGAAMTSAGRQLTGLFQPTGIIGVGQGRRGGSARPGLAIPNDGSPLPRRGPRRTLRAAIMAHPRSGRRGLSGSRGRAGLDVSCSLELIWHERALGNHRV